jgi:hypothetical protein
MATIRSLMVICSSVAKKMIKSSVGPRGSRVLGGIGTVEIRMEIIHRTSIPGHDEAGIKNINRGNFCALLGKGDCWLSAATDFQNA